MKREEYRKFQWLASVCIAVFILSFAVCLLAFNRSVYRLSSTDYRNGVTVEISKAEAARRLQNSETVFRARLCRARAYVRENFGEEYKKL